MKNFLKIYKTAKALFVFPLMLAITIGAFIFFMSSSVFAGNPNIYVSPDDSIQEAINTAEEGDTITVKNGTYEENVNVNKAGITLRAKNRHKATIEGYVRISADNVTLNGFNVDYTESDSNAPIDLGNVKDVTIEFNKVEGGTDAGGISSWTGPVGVYGDVIIRKNEVIGGPIGIMPSTSEDSEIAIQNNTITGAEDEGIWVSQNEKAHLIIRGNEIINSGKKDVKIVDKPLTINSKEETLDMKNAILNNNRLESVLFEWIENVHNVTQDTFYSTIQGAIDDAYDGDMIRVASGKYEENLTVDEEGLTLISSEKHGAIIKGYVNIQADGVDFRRFKISPSQGDMESNLTALKISSNNVSVIGNLIADIYADAGNISQSAKGIHVYNNGDPINNITIKRNKIRDINLDGTDGGWGDHLNLYGVYIQGSIDGVNLDDNIIEDLWSAGYTLGISVGHTETSKLETPDNVKIINNTIRALENGDAGYDIPAVGFEISSSEGNPEGVTKVENNTFKDLKVYIADSRKNNPDFTYLNNYLDNNNYEAESRVVDNAILPVSILESAILNGVSNVFGSDKEDVLTFTFSSDIKLGDGDQNVYFKDASKLGPNSQDWSIEDNVLRVKANRELNNPRPEIGDFVLSFDEVIGSNFEHNVFVPESGVEVKGIETKIISPNEGDEVDIKESLNLEAFSKYDEDVNWVVRKGECSSSGGDRTVAGNLYGYENDYNWIENQWHEGLFTSSLYISSWDTGEYCFAFDPNPGEGNRKTVSFNVIDAQPGITSPEENQEIPQNQELVLGARDFEAANGGVHWAVRAGSCSNNTLAGNVHDQDDDYTWENGIFNSILDISEWDTGEYCFAFNPSAGDRYTRQFEIVEAEEVTLTIWTWDPEWGDTDPVGSDTRRDNVDYIYTKGETISLIATPKEGHDFRIWNVWENYGEENQTKRVSYHREPELELLMDTDLLARAQFWEEEVKLESAVYEGKCSLFGSDIGDSLTFTFSRNIKSSEDKMYVHFENGDKFWFPDEGKYSYEIDDNVLTITIGPDEIFGSPRDVIGKNISSFTGITDVSGNDISFTEGVVEVSGSGEGVGEIDANASSASWFNNQDGTGTMSLNVLDKCGNGIEEITKGDFAIWPPAGDWRTFNDVNSYSSWDLTFNEEGEGDYNVLFDLVNESKIPFSQAWDIQALSETIEENLQINVTYVENPDPIPSTYSFNYDTSNPYTAGEDVVIPVTFQTDELGGIGYDGVRFAFEATSTSTGDVTFTATDTEDTEHTITNEEFWGPPEGFNLPANYSATTDWTLNFSKAGDYNISFSLIDADNYNVINGIEDSISVRVEADDSGENDNGEGGDANNSNGVTTLSFGGGGSSGGGNICTWVEYGDWSECNNGVQFRDVVNKNNDFCSLTTEQQLNRERKCSENESGGIVPGVLGDTDYADGTLLKGNDVRIFVVFGDYIYHLKNAKELSNFKGPILVVSDEVISSFVKITKDDIPSKYKDVLGDKKYADGVLVRVKGDVKIYIIKNGKKIHIKSPKELSNYKGPILVVEADELNNY